MRKFTNQRKLLIDQLIGDNEFIELELIKTRVGELLEEINGSDNLSDQIQVLKYISKDISFKYMNNIIEMYSFEAVKMEKTNLILSLSFFFVSPSTKYITLAHFFPLE